MWIENEKVNLLDQLEEKDIPQTSVALIAAAIRANRAEMQFAVLSKAPETRNGFSLRLSMGGLTIHIDDPSVPPWR